MRKSFYICLLLALFTSCKENQDITTFDLNQRYLNFSQTDTTALTYDINYLGTSEYSFALEEQETNVKKVGIPIAMAGKMPEQDLNYTVAVNQELTTLPKDAYTFDPFIYRKGRVKDSVFVQVKKIEAMKNKKFILALDIVENENFKVGHNKATSFQLTVSNMLSEPSWWSRYTDYMGPYYPEVYQQWIYTYVEGADPTLSPVTNKPYLYWGNMPTYIPNLPEDYPILYHHILKLKKYFQENVVYPNGDSSKPRILLP